MPFSFPITANIWHRLFLMISSKKINLTALLLTALVLIGAVCAMFIPKDILGDIPLGEISYSDIHKVTLTDDDYYQTFSSSSVTKISLKGSTAETKSQSVEINDGNIIIRSGGTYVLSGRLNDGTITVDSEDSAQVRLILNNAEITSSNSFAISINQAEKTVLSLVPSTNNSLACAKSNQDDSENTPNAVLYSKDDLTINGTGYLSIEGSGNGIKANDTLKIIQASVSVNSEENGIKANDCIFMFKSILSINSGKDALKCEHEKEEKGFIAIESSTISLDSDGDGLCSSSSLYLNNLSANITAGDQNAVSVKKNPFEKNINSDEPSTKAIKSAANISVNGGTYTLNSFDDAIHSDRDINILGGKFTISSNDDAVHADTNLTVNPDDMKITKCYEGLEGAYITINGGNISIIADDDGINATGTSDFERSRGMRNGISDTEKTSEEDIWLTINNGHIYIEANGDGIDSNGSAVMNGGYVEIYGPENDGNGSIDVGDGGYVFLMNGGTLIAAGSSGMAVSPSEISSQCSLSFYLEDSCPQQSTVSLTDKSGNKLLSATPSKKFSWVCVSTDKITAGEEYTLTINGEKSVNITADKVSAVSGSKSNSHSFPERRPK